LSKEHAVIEVVDENNHLIYDLGSRNKTRLSKVNSNFKKKSLHFCVGLFWHLGYGSLKALNIQL